jgi:membrane protein DedA with SNARE-associated domain
MATILEQLNQLIVHLENWGYVVVFVVVLLECQAFLGLFMPGESLVMLSGFLAGQEVLDVRTLIIVVALGAIIGDSIGYEFGRWLGRDWLRRHGPKFWLRPERLDQVDAFFARYGGLGVFFAHFLHLGRALMPFLAGASRLPYLRFLFYNALGCILWASIFTLLGYAFGQSWHLIDRWVGRAGVVGIILLASLVVTILLWRWIAVRELEIRTRWAHFIARPSVVRLRLRFGRQIDWLEDRVSPKGYLGIHLTVGVFLLLAAAAIFGGTVEGFGTRAVFVAIDSRVEEWFASRTTAPMSALMEGVTRLGSLVWLGILLLLALFIWRQHRHRLRLLLLAGPGGVLLDLVLKFFFAHVRRQPALEEGYSLTFFQGDVFAATVFYGAFAYVLLRSLPRWRLGVLSTLLSMLVVLIVAFGRIYLGGLGLSDALVAMIEGAVWLLLCISGVEIVRWREEAHEAALRFDEKNLLQKQNHGDRGVEP